MVKYWGVVKGDLVFAGISSLSGQPMWFAAVDDIEHLSSCGAVRTRRDPRWLALARKYSADVEWKLL